MSPIDTVKAAYAAFAKNDPTVLFGAMSPSVTWNEAEGSPLADGNPYVGPQAIGERLFPRLLGSVDNFTVTPSTFIDGGDHVVVTGRYGGSVKATSERVDAPFCHVYRFENGKIATFQQYTDTAHWSRLMR
jgi:uncharacterized protein